MLGLIYAEQGNFAEARRIWSELAAAEPHFAPARANLALLERIDRAPHGQASAGISALRTAALGDPR